MQQIFTIGYEGRTILEVMRILESNNIRCLVDVREYPNSRKRGFSKSQLQAALTERGIRYLHMKELGTPKEIRQELRLTGDYEGFFRKYRSHLKQQDGIQERLLGLLDGGPLCFLCYERSAARCHRSAVVDFIKQLHQRPVVVVEHI